MYLLDTNFCISYLRGRNASVLERFSAHLPAQLSVCATVRSELVYGALRSSDPTKQLAVVDRFLGPLTCHPLNERVADASARIRAQLASRGTMIGPYDLQIAATAVVHNLILVTHNAAEFSRVAGLNIEDWEI